MPDSDTRYRMLRVGVYLSINMPDMFADEEFIDYLNDPDNVLGDEFSGREIRRFDPSEGHRRPKPMVAEAPFTR